MKLIWGMVFMALTATAALAQGGGVNHYSAAELQQMAHKLEQQESYRTTGSAGETLDKYPGSFTMLTVRGISGGAEMHEHYADIFFIVAGEATLTTGGTVIDPKTTAPGEIRGSGVSGGVRQKLGKGDVVHISPNMPHQLSIAKGTSLTYFVVKVKE
ncbi:MAG: cupin domain-containing protein [Acidobacteriaceae bacterium]